MEKIEEENRVMKKFLALSFFLSLLALLASAEEPFSKQIANYTIDVRLDASKKLLKATETLSWTNDTERSTDELWFHLYWNAFQNNMSTFLREASEEESQVESFKKDDWGYCRLISIKIVKNSFFEGNDLAPSMEFRHPDDENIHDQTVFSVKLPKPVEPGQTIVLDIEFESKIPKPISRTGVYKDYYFISQWFPKIGVFEDGRWNCHEYHALSEYFADYGTYDVRITFPFSFIVGATGELKERIDNPDGTKTFHFSQHSVHDFAWTASPRFLEYKENFEFAPGKKTEITLLLQPEHLKLRERYMNAVKNAIKYCSLFYGDYPYATATCVDPAYNSRSGGMEYPTLFTGGAYFLTKKGIPIPEGVTIHEFGHGYFYGLVGSNEFENPWMDEGFTSFLDSEVYYAAYGEPLYSKTYFGIPVTFREVKIPIESEGISEHRLTSDMDIIQRFSWEFLGDESYGANSYQKAQLMLRTLKRYMGEALFSRMIKAYSQRFWWKHPRPQDFYAVVSEFAGKDMSWFLDQFIYGSEKLDYALGDIINRKESEPQGWFEGKYKEPFPKIEKVPLYHSEVIVRRLGGVKIPVDVLIVSEDKKEVRETWDGQYRWKKFIFKGRSRVERAVVDPEFKLVLDVNRTNNSLSRKSNWLAPLKWVSNWLLRLQHALEFFTIFGG
jgi:hypothetical protein